MSAHRFRLIFVLLLTVTGSAESAPPSLEAGVGRIPSAGPSGELPNCAGVALFNTGALKKSDYVDPAYELPGILQHCYVVNPSGPRRGDIGVISDKRGMPVHAWVEIGDKNLVISKDGTEPIPIAKRERSQMIAFYRRDFSGRKITYHSPNSSAFKEGDCPIDIETFRKRAWEGSLTPRQFKKR